MQFTAFRDYVRPAAGNCKPATKKETRIIGVLTGVLQKETMEISDLVRPGWRGVR